jgi:hypothetical protein
VVRSQPGQIVGDGFLSRKNPSQIRAGVVTLSQPVQAGPRNMTESNGRLRKDKRQTFKKAGIRWAGCSGGNKQRPWPLPANLFYTAANKEVEYRSRQSNSSQGGAILQFLEWGNWVATFCMYCSCLKVMV